ncbi:glutamate receptor ionotropic, delta-2 isoform X1 [Procambarus clarkii]|uniref:glutamate receptor ionotropic, delta-2 isoform X1 n=1 Tax=Procambarus clarkii TaxID=6728 RepID=UPI001E67844E|nr:glutamate receptor ionotropic, delta-2-like isoform X2 [Procambarus clarkii]
MLFFAAFSFWGLFLVFSLWHFLFLLAPVTSPVSSFPSSRFALTTRRGRVSASPGSLLLQQAERDDTEVIIWTPPEIQATLPRSHETPFNPLPTPPGTEQTSGRQASSVPQTAVNTHTTPTLEPYHLKTTHEGTKIWNTVTRDSAQEPVLPSDEYLHATSIMPTGARQKRERSGWLLSEAETASLVLLLTQVVHQELTGCALVVAYDPPYHQSSLLHHLLRLPHLRQVVEVRALEDLARLVWRSTQCQGYLLLFKDPAPLAAFVDVDEDSWDYHGRFVVVGTTKDQLQSLALSKKGAKTEHLLGLVKSWREGSWVVYTNNLYRKSPLRRLTTWRSTSFTTSTTTLFPDKLANLRGSLLKVSTFEWEPSVLYYRDVTGKLQFPYGIDIEVVNALSSVINFTVVFEEPPSGEFWGVMSENGSWSGMMGKLFRNEADLGVANLFLTLGRLGAVDYSAPYDAEVSCFMVRTDPPAPQWLSLALPFQGATWATLMGGVMAAGLVVFCLASLGARCGGGEVKSLESLVFAYFFSFSMHFRDPQAVLPRRNHMRIFVSFLGLYAIIITTAYSSNLTAFLTVTRSPQSMDTIKELCDSDMEISGLGGFFKGALASAVDPYLQRLGDRFVGYQELEVVWPKVRKGRAAYLHNRQFLEFVITTHFSSQGVTSMRIMKECFAPYSIAMALQHHSPLKTNFDRVIRWMIESGLVRRWFLQSLRFSRKAREKTSHTEADSSKRSGSLDEESQSSNNGIIQPLGIKHIQGLFFLLIIGYLCSLLAFLLENCFIKLYRKHKR